MNRRLISFKSTDPEICMWVCNAMFLNGILTGLGIAYIIILLTLP